MSEEFSSPKKESGVFWIEVEKIRPNPMQPRREFDEEKLSELAESIQQYGVLQPLVVSRKEFAIPTGTAVEYELIAGERRLMASKKAGLKQVPVIIREEPIERIKLELALIENIQREDLNPIERARAFRQLIDNFKLKHHEVGAKIGKSREFVTNSLRILALPEEMQTGLGKGLISEGHTRPLLMLSQQPEEQAALYKEIIYKQMNVREAERISRRIAVERTRKREEALDPELRSLEEKLSEKLGTRVSIERKGEKGKISIEFFSDEELRSLLSRVNGLDAEVPNIAEEFKPVEGVFVENASDAAGNTAQEKEDIADNFTI